MKCHYRNVKAKTKVYKPCLSFFISFSFHVSVTFSSSSKSLFPHFINPSTLTVCTHDLWNNRILSFSQSVHATYKTMTDYHQCGAHSGSPQLLTSLVATFSFQFLKLCWNKLLAIRDYKSLFYRVIINCFIYY